MFKPPVLNRRRFLYFTAATTAVAATGYTLLSPRNMAIPGSLLGPSMDLGHKLRDRGPIPEPAHTETVDVAIVGGGISGLAAGYRLRNHTDLRYTLLELETEPGGNARGGGNAVSRYPWGAHYVPLLDEETTEVQRLFLELGIITGYDERGRAYYNPYFLCADPQERLYRHGRWQEGLIPQLGLPEEDASQIQVFLQQMDALKSTRGLDGRKAFALPLDNSSTDSIWRDLDKMTFAAWLQQAGFNSRPLLWYLNYACRDDFGTTLETTSAWAGLFYFAARDPQPASAQAHNVITWPEGNAWLVERLAEPLASHLVTGAVVRRIQRAAEDLHIDYWHVSSNRMIRVIAKAVILAVPRPIIAHIANDAHLTLQTETFRYTPWAIANITLDRLPGGLGETLSWDNVVYDSPLLGYVVATHQHLQSKPQATVLTYYWPLTHTEPEIARREAQGRSHADWSAKFLTELLRVHPELRNHVRQIDVWIWGHGMIRPEPGFIWGEARQRAAKHQPPYFFAHSDLSGISVFEEAYTRGVKAAEAAMTLLKSSPATT